MDETFEGTPPKSARACTFISGTKTAIMLALCALALSACASHHHRGPQRGYGPPGGFERPGGGAFSGDVMAPPVALLFDDYDRDHDRRVTEAELKAGAEASFAEADADKSGSIPALEYQAWAEKALGSKDALPGFLLFDTDMNGSISHDEFVKGLASEFTHLDANKDLVLERSELVAIGASFARGQFGGRGEGGGGGWSRRQGGERRRGGGGGGGDGE